MSDAIDIAGAFVFIILWQVEESQGVCIQVIDLQEIIIINAISNDVNVKCIMLFLIMLKLQRNCKQRC